MSTPDPVGNLDQYAGVLPHPNAPDNAKRLALLEQRLRAGELDLFEVAEEALKLLKGEPAISAHTYCLLCISKWHFHDLRFEIAERYATLAVKVAHATGDAMVCAKALTYLSSVLTENGKQEEAISALLEALQHSDVAPDSFQRAMILNNLGLTLMQSACYGAAYECFEQSIALFPTDVIQRTNQAELFFHLGDFARGILVAREALQFATKVETLDELRRRIELEVCLVLLLVSVGDLSQARERAQIVGALAKGSNDYLQRLSDAPLLLLDAHDPAKAEEALRVLVSETQIAPARSDLCRTYRTFTVAALRGVGRPDEALAFLREMAQLDGTNRASVANLTLPIDIAGTTQGSLDAVADAHVRSQRDLLLEQMARREEKTHERLEGLISLAIRTELREEEAFSNGEHVFRVARLAELLADEANCSENDRSNVRLAGLLHDIGKIFLPEQLLLKSGTLTELEKALVTRHSEDGAALLENLDNNTPAAVANIVRHSHERWDGHGYPAGLSGVSIPMGARIIAICDSFDVMMHWRPYRQPLTFAQALSQIESGSGAQYDPQLVSLFLSLVRRLNRETGDLDRFLGEGGEKSPVVQAQRRLARYLRMDKPIL